MDLAVTEINNLVRRAKQRSMEAMELYCKAGERLVELREQKKDQGIKWKQFVKDNFEFSYESCNDYINLAKRWDDLCPYFESTNTPSIDGAKTWWIQNFGKPRTKKEPIKDTEMWDAVNELWTDLPDDSTWYRTLRRRSQETIITIDDNKDRPRQAFGIALDSGAFSKHVRELDPNSPAHFEYLEDYAWFIKRHEHQFDFYANFDVMGNPELSHRNLLYLESHGLTPMPVVHYQSDWKWLDYYLDRYSRIGLGGVADDTDKPECKKWIAEFFKRVEEAMDQPETVVHGFGVGSHELITSHPWASVDHKSWIDFAGYGMILVPQRKNGESCFDDPHMILRVSTRDNPLTLSDKEREITSAWLDEIDISLQDVSTKSDSRIAANLWYYEFLRSNKSPNTVIYYSGNRRAEDVLQNTANVMPTFFDLRKAREPRFNDLLNARHHDDYDYD